jgi:integrase/recombinase XerD
MRLDEAVDDFIRDLRAQGRIRSPHSELAYRTKLEFHAKDVLNRDPSKVGREDIKRTLSRWDPPLSPNSRNQAHAVLRSFYDWCCHEGLRDTNPARMVMPARYKEPQLYRLTRAETLHILQVADEDLRDRWIARLGILAGLRSQELRFAKGLNFGRDGFIWVDEEMGKGGKQRFIPVVDELQPVVLEIRQFVGQDAYIMPGRRNRKPPGTGMMVDGATAQAASSLYLRVKKLGERAGIPGRVTPHSLRHAFGDLVARYAGPRAAQVAMGHASIETTTGTYLSGMTLDELALAFSGLRIDMPQLSPSDRPEIPRG